MKIIALLLLSLSIKITLVSTKKLKKRSKRAQTNLIHDEKVSGYNLLDFLFQNYVADIRPVRNVNENITVTLDVFPFQLLGLDEKNQILTSYLWVRQRWKDPKLTWNPAQFNNITEIRIPCHKVWLPDIVLYNNADPNFDRAMDTNIIVRSTGDIMWDQPYITRTSCQLQVGDFPFDQQECDFIFGSWTYHGGQLDIIKSIDETTGKPLEEADITDFVPNLEWQVTAMPVRREESTFSCCIEVYPIIEFKMKLKRKSKFYVFNLIIPCFLISLLAPFTFYLPAHSGEKVSLGVTVLLALTVFQLLVAEIMPPNDIIPLIGKYYIATMATISLSTALSILVLNVHHCGDFPNEPPKWIERFAFEVLEPWLGFDIPINYDHADKSIDVRLIPDQQANQNNSAFQRQKTKLKSYFQRTDPFKKYFLDQKNRNLLEKAREGEIFFTTESNLDEMDEDVTDSGNDESHNNSLSSDSFGFTTTSSEKVTTSIFEDSKSLCSEIRTLSKDLEKTINDNNVKTLNQEHQGHDSLRNSNSHQKLNLGGKILQHLIHSKFDDFGSAAAEKPNNKLRKKYLTRPISNGCIATGYDRTATGIDEHLYEPLNLYGASPTPNFHSKLDDDDIDYSGHKLVKETNSKEILTMIKHEMMIITEELKIRQVRDNVKFKWNR